MKIAIHGRKIMPDRSSTISSILSYLTSKGVDLCMYKPFYFFLLNELKLECQPLQLYCHTEEIPADTTLMLSIGGDGTFLDAARFVRDRGFPLLGINLGRLGFLAYVSSDDAISSLEQVIEGNYTIEERSTISVSGDFIGSKLCPSALNEVSVQRKGPAMIETEVLINGEALSTYWSDGLLIATPTGSTAYALSVGGPIISPDTPSLMVIPIAPHNLSIRPIIIPDSSTITVKVRSLKEPAMVTVDNQMFDIESESIFFVQKSAFAIRLVKLTNSNFYRILRDKLLWGVDPRG